MDALLFALSSSATTNLVATAITNVDFSAMLSEIIALLPVVLPIIVSFLAIRKGISFLIGSLRRA